MKILVLSPHRDDAAFSLSLSIIHWLGLDNSVILLNCFTRSLYAPFSDVDQSHPNDRLSYVSAMRRREDESFLRRTPGANGKNFSMVDLNIKDAPLRLRCSSDVVCDMPVHPEDSAVSKIRKVMTRLTLSSKVDALVLPLALGHHVDHRTARDAALPFSLTMPCAFYEDLPYATRQGVRVDLEAFQADAATRLHESLSPVLCHAPEGAAIKRRLSLGYTSQIDSDTADLISSFAERYDGGERLWANSAWLDLAALTQISSPQLQTQSLPG